MTCKECICYEKCKNSRLDFAESAEPNHICQYFKHKDGVVEVVRCKDCKFRKTNDCAMYYECDCGSQYDWENDNDFCSYGERRE